MIKVLMRVFDSDVGWMDWSVRWFRAGQDLKASSPAVNKSLLNQGVGPGIQRKV